VNERDGMNITEFFKRWTKIKAFFVFSIIFLLTLLVYLPVKIPAASQNGDNMWYIPQVISLYTENNMNLDEFPDRIKEVHNYAIIDLNNHKLNYFPYGTVRVNYPLTLLTKNFFACDFKTEKEKIDSSNKIAELNAKIFASFSVALMFLIVLKLTQSYRQSLLLTFIFAFASPHFSNHAGGLWSHNISVFLITLTLYLMVAREKVSYFSALPLAFSYITRPTMSLSVIFLSLYYFLTNKFSTFVKFSLIGIIIGLSFITYNMITFDSILPPYYAGSRLSFEHFSEALFGHLVSPNRGLFIFFPIALFSIIGGYLAFKNKENILYRILFVMVIICYVIYSMFPHWWMGYSYGPRIFAEIIPYLILLIIPAIAWIKQSALMKIIFAITVVWSIFVQIMGVSSDKSFSTWNASPISVDTYPEKIWSWQDMQILREFTVAKNYAKPPIASKIEQLTFSLIKLNPSAEGKIKLNISNIGSEVWQVKGDKSGKYPIRLSYHIVDINGNIIIADGVRTILPYDIKPDRIIPITMKIIAPTQPGQYFLQIELVQEGVMWFGDMDISNRLTIPLEVK
jgi:hypothetical protein